MIQAASDASLNCPVRGAASPPPPLPHLHPLTRTSFLGFVFFLCLFCLFGCLLPATSTVKYSDLVELCPSSLSSCCPESGRLSPLSIRASFPFFFLNGLQNISNLSRDSLFYNYNQTSLMSAVVSPYPPPPPLPSPTLKGADLCRLTWKCREFYCTKMLEPCAPPVVVGDNCRLETTEDPLTGGRRRGGKRITFGFYQPACCIMATLTFVSMLLVCFLSLSLIMLNFFF